MQLTHFTVATAFLVATACFRPTGTAADSVARADSTTSIPAPVTSAGAPVPRLLGVGDTFELRVADNIAIGSLGDYPAYCSSRPPLSEFLIVSDTLHYHIVRIVDEGCGNVAVDTQLVEGTYLLSRDTVQFYRGGGKELELGYRGVIAGDILEVFSGTPLRTLTFERRRAGVGPTDPWDLRSGTFSHFVLDEPRGDTTWIANVRNHGRDAVVLFGYNVRGSNTEPTLPGVVVESLSVRLVHHEMPYGNCGLNGRKEWRRVLALVNRGPEDPVARLAWRLSRETGRLVPVPADSVQCEPESYGD